MQDFDYFLFFGWFDLFSKINDLFFNHQNLVDIFPEFMNSLCVGLNNMSAYDIDFVIRPDGDFVDEVSDGEFSTFWQNVLNVSGSDEFTVLDDLQDASLIFASLEFLISFIFLSLFEKQNLVSLD